MSATVTTGRRVGAFRAPDGRIIYLGFESTFEKNVIPHKPDWSCVGIGELPEFLQRIFSFGASCEGGMLQNRSGHITPEGYIRSWMNELRTPVEVANRGLTLWPEPDKLPETEVILARMGRGDVIEKMRTEKYATLRLFEDVDTVLALYGIKDGIYPAWKVLNRSVHLEGDRNASLGYNPVPAKAPSVSADFPHFLRVGDEEHLIRTDDGSYCRAGRAYSLVGSFVQEFYQEELRFPGSFARRIKAFRAHVANAPAVSLDALIVVVDLTAASIEKWQQRTIEQFREQHPVTETATGFKAQLTPENLHLATILPDQCTRWILPNDVAAA